jgi:hypothetical protein
LEVKSYSPSHEDNLFKANLKTEKKNEGDKLTLKLLLDIKTFSRKNQIFNQTV